MRDILAALRTLGLSSTSLCRAAGLEHAALNEPGTRVTYASVLALFAEAERRTGDRLVGLHAGEHTEASGVLAYLVMSCASLEDGLRYAERFSRLIGSRVRIHLNLHRDVAHLLLDVGAAGSGVDRHLTDYVLMAAFRTLRRVGGPELRLREVHVRHEAYGHEAESARVFGCPVRFRQPTDALVLSRRDLQATPRMANAAVAEQLEKFAAALAARPDSGATVRDQVVHVTRDLLSAGHRPDRTAVARRLGMSSGTLRRRLAEEQTTFKVVRDAVLWEVVDALLSSPALKMEAVALSVGFADVAAFSKAFRRRAGYPPSRYREQLGSPATRHRRAARGSARAARIPRRT